MKGARVDYDLTDRFNIIEEWEKKIDNMSHEELARLRRFAPSGHPVFNTDYPLYEYFEKRFNELGGMTPEISKKIGWEKPDELEF